MPELNGIDISNHQGTFDWAAWKGKIQFAFAKATEGLDYRDPDFPRNSGLMRTEGLVRGAYHFLHASVSGAAQAHYFLAYAQPQPGDLIAVDIEQAGLDGCDAEQVSACAAGFADTIRAAVKAWPWAYTEISLAYGGYCAALGSCPAWLADPSQVPTPPPVGPWHVITAEQTGQRGADTDVFYGDMGQLGKLAIPHEMPKPPPPKPQPGVTPAQAEAALAVAGRFVTEHRA